MKGVLHLLPQLACFAIYLKIINIFLKNSICIFNIVELTNKGMNLVDGSRV